MSNLLMDATGDLDFNGGLKIVKGREAYAQRLKNAFEYALGEWFLNITEGIPYFQVIFEKNTSREIITQICKSVILRDKETSNIEQFDLQIDRSNRTMDLYFVARSINGELADFSVTPLQIDIFKVDNNAVR